MPARGHDGPLTGERDYYAEGVEKHLNKTVSTKKNQIRTVAVFNGEVNTWFYKLHFESKKFPSGSGHE